MNVFVLNVFEDNCSYGENYVRKSVRDAGVIWYEHGDTNQMPLPAKHSQLHPVKNPTKKHTNNRFLKSIIKSMKLLPNEKLDTGKLIVFRNGVTLLSILIVYVFLSVILTNLFNNKCRRVAVSNYDQNKSILQA